MTTAPRPSAVQQAHPSTTAQQIKRYFDALPLEEGLIEVAIGKIRKDDPSKIDAYPTKPEWGEGHRFRRYTADTRDQIVQDLAKLIRRYSNVYISRARYQSPQRKETEAKPSRILFFDDVQPDPIFSMLVQTSEHSYQGYIYLNEATDAATIRELSERGAKALKGTKGKHADSCHDVTRLVRVPGGYNTKNHSRFLVRIISAPQHTYSVDQLREQWTEVEHKEHAQIDFSWDEAEHCYRMIDGIEKRIGRHTKTYKDLHGDGGKDRSKTRWGLACELRKRYAYPDEEIAALLYEYNHGHLEEKGSAWLIKDIKRCIADANQLYPDITTKPSYCRLHWNTKPPQPLPTVTPKSRARKDRPHKIDADGLLAWYKRRIDASGIVFLTRAEAAKALKISVPTLDRLERQLRERGLLERHTAKDRRRSWVAILGAINIRQPVQETASDPVLSATAEIPQEPAENSKSDASKVVHTPPVAFPAEPDAQPTPRAAFAEDVPAVRLVDAARAALEAACAVESGRPSHKRFVRAFGDYFGHIRLADGRLRQVYADTLQARRRERTILREHAKIRAAEPKELRRWARAYAWNHMDARKHGNEKQAYLWGCKAQLVEEEIERRQQAGEWPAERRRRTRTPQACPVPRPDPGPPATVEAVAPSGGVCSTARAVGGRQLELCGTAGTRAAASSQAAPACPLRTVHDVVLTTADMVNLQVNKDQIKFLLEQLPKRGPLWARGHMATVGGFDAWPWHVRRAVWDVELGRGGGCR